MPRRPRRSNLTSLVKKIVNKQVETKHVTYAAVGWTDIGSVSGTLQDITQINQGVADTQRIGNSIYGQKLFIQKLLRVEDNTGIPHASIRVLVVQARGAPLTTSDMPAFAAPVDLDKMHVLVDRMVNLSSTGQNSAGTYFGSTPYRLKLNLRKFKRHIHYDGATNTPINNALYLYMLCDNANGQQTGFETFYFKDA